MNDFWDAPLFPPPGHDHNACLERILQRARLICSGRGVRLTVLRERVLREIASTHTALGAYDIIERLAGEGRRLAPISVYRIIEVLAEAGLVHRLESRNAYFACQGGHDSGCHAARPADSRHDEAEPGDRIHEKARRGARGLLLVLLCNRCGQVAEAPANAAQQVIDDLARAVAFTVTGSVLELQGLCADCADRPGEPLAREGAA